jgi:hypothetical protein
LLVTTHREGIEGRGEKAEANFKNIGSCCVPDEANSSKDAAVNRCMELKLIDD